MFQQMKKFLQFLKRLIVILSGHLDSRSKFFLHISIQIDQLFLQSTVGNIDFYNIIISKTIKQHSSKA